ncbi:MAG: hypothetical protein KTR13_01040 [Saprospiraceae bacterium]|nr:hypothetical protein [Saprospiraceae bacterium]
MNTEVVVDRLKWAKTKEFIKQRFGQYPSVTSALFLIGLQEIGLVHDELSKEEKQEVMHVGVCTLLAQEGFYNLVGKDEDGWPHYETTKKIDSVDIDNQENLLKKLIIDYFEAYV